MASSLLAGILSAVATTAGNIALSERQRKMNEQNQDKVNEYNLPVNQVQRLKDAGINPNALSSGNSSVVPGNTSAGMNPYTTPSLSDPFSLATNSFLNMAQGNTEEQMRQVRKEQALKDIELMDANVSKLGVESEYQGIINTFAAAREMAAIRGENSQSALNFWQINKVKQEARQIAKYIDEVMPEEISKLIAEKHLTVGQLDQVIATIANINKDTELKGSQIDVNDTQASLNVEQRGLVAQESANYSELISKILSKYQAEMNKLVAETGLTEQEAFYYLYDIAQKHSIRFFGLPIMSQGGIKNSLNQQDIQDQVRNKYFSE